MIKIKTLKQNEEDMSNRIKTLTHKLDENSSQRGASPKSLDSVDRKNFPLTECNLEYIEERLIQREFMDLMVKDVDNLTFSY